MADRQGITVWRRGKKWNRSVKYGKNTSVVNGFDCREDAWADGWQLLRLWQHPPRFASNPMES